MNNTKTKNATKFFNPLIDLIRHRQEMPYYRIVQLPTETEAYIHIQIVNKRTILKMLPEEIMRDNLLMGFSKADIALICHLGTKNELKNTKPERKFFKILKQIFHKNTYSFLLEKENSLVEEHSASEICNNAEIVENLKGEDGIKVGYSMAEEHYQKILELKKTKV